VYQAESMEAAIALAARIPAARLGARWRYDRASSTGDKFLLSSKLTGTAVGA
jgi:hypothetical protein